MEKICVAVRVRPPVAPQDSIHGMFWNIRDNHISLHKDSGTPISGVSYSFDHVFDQTCPNSRVYDLLTKDIIRAALEGFNGTVFAYGQTSSGKTFTMNGSENDPGVIHRAVKDIFDMIQAHEEREFLIRVSYMEIYNEEINDLLVLHSQKLPIHESLERGVFVAGLREEIVNNAEQVHKLLEAGEVNRHFGETNMNVRSSRSHTIFRMVIESKSKEIDSSKGYPSSDAIRVSVLNLVDLAGSERIAKTGADGVRLKEGKHINKSLMVLGNVINKLSEGAKQRGHIPYRDSKLTRILQSALGGNAKTSIICTVAPEEVHVEETKGTLQFANRAKRVTNCAQVNEILTDAALLKRQKLEIEELRQKLQGSMAEVLEQEVLKLRNDLLKYELEREKLATELEEERRLLRQRDEHMKEQQIKIENLSNLVNSSASHQKSYSQKEDLSRCISERSSSSLPMWQEDALSTPGPNSFVIKRSNYTTCDGDSSPLPDAFNNVVDEDLWMKMNKGYVADLDSIQMTPAVKTQSLSSDGISPGFSKDRYELEIQNLKRQMELAVKEREELEKRHREQLLVNNQLTEEIVKLEGEVKLSGETPQMLCKSVSTCKKIYKDVLSVMQSSVADEKSFANQLLSSMSEIGTNLFTTLETCCTMDRDGLRTFSSDNGIVKEQCKLLCEKLNSTIALLASSEVSSTEEKELSTRSSCGYKGLDFEGDPACWKEKLSDVLNTIRDKYTCLEKDVDPSSQVLEDSKARYIDLERKFTVLKEENESLLDKVSKATENLKTVSEQKEMFLEKYTNEVQLRKDLEEGIHILKEERDSLLDKVSNLTENLRTVSEQREMLLEKYNDVMQKRKDLEERISVLREERDTLLDKESRLCENLQRVSEQREMFLEKYDDAMQRRKDLEEGINVLKEERDTLLDKVSTLSENLQTVSEQRELFLEKYNNAMQRRKELEEGINVLKEERNTLLEKLSKSTENLETVSEQREMFLKKYNNEVQRRKDLEEGIKRVNAAFASRQKSLVSFHSNLKSRVECLRAQNPVVVSNSPVS